MSSNPITVFLTKASVSVIVEIVVENQEGEILAGKLVAFSFPYIRGFFQKLSFGEGRQSFPENIKYVHARVRNPLSFHEYH